MICCTQFSMILLALAAAPAPQAAAQTPGSPDPAAGSVTTGERIALSTATAPSGGDLTLWMQRLPALSNAERIRYITEHPEAGDVPNVVFGLSEERPGEGEQVLWLHYTYENRTVRPLPEWRGSVLRAPGSDAIYVLMARTIASSTRLEVQKVNPANAPAGPLEFDTGSYRKWPAGSPAAEGHMVSFPCHACGLAHLEAGLQNGVIRVETRCSSSECEAVVSEFEVQAGAWRNAANPSNQD